MKTLCVFALFLVGYAQAGELLPMSGKHSSHMQQALDEHLAPAVASLDQSVTVEPILESIDISGRGKRLFLGPLAGSSHIVLRIRVTDEDRVTDEVFSTEGGAWKGTFRPGRDYELVRDIAKQAAEYVQSLYGKRL